MELGAGRQVFSWLQVRPPTEPLQGYQEHHFRPSPPRLIPPPGGGLVSPYFSGSIGYRTPGITLWGELGAGSG
jgi:hypothetical protein